MIETAVDPTRVVLAIIVAAGLLLLTPVLLRRFRPTNLPDAGAEDLPCVVAQRSLDMRHRLVVVRHRGVEHLLVLGGSVPLVLGRAEPSGAAKGAAS